MSNDARRNRAAADERRRAAKRRAADEADRTAYTRVSITDARDGDEVFQAGEWHRIDSVTHMRHSTNVHVRFTDGGTHNAPAHHFTVRRPAGTTEPVPAPVCEGSGKPVGGGSACETCGTSFGFPHPANLVVGKPAPSHPVTLNADSRYALYLPRRKHPLVTMRGTAAAAYLTRNPGVIARIVKVGV